MKCYTQGRSMDELKFWGAATVGSKGQFVIPAEARDKLGIHEGDKILVLSAPGQAGFIAVKPEVLETHMRKMSSGLETLLSDTEITK